MNYQLISERMMLVRFRGKARNLTAVQRYAPSEDAYFKKKVAFYDVLNSTIANVPKRDLILLMGDFNAKKGGDNESMKHVIGKHRVEKMNENREVLVEC